MNVMNKDLSPAPDPRKFAPRGLADMIGITAALTMLRRRMLLVSIVGVAVAALTFAFMMLRPPTYTATSLLILTPRQEAAATAAAAESGIDSEIELLRSPALMNDLAVALGIQNEGVADSNVIGDLASAIEIRRRNSTFIVEIVARASDAERAQMIANTYADVYIASQLNPASNNPALAGNSRLAQRLAELRGDAQAAEDAVEAYRAEAGIQNADSAPLEQQISSLQSELQRAQSELAERDARQRQFQQLRESGASTEAIANAFNSPALVTLRERDADVRRRQNDLETRYLPSHPAVQAVRVERQDIDTQIEREVQRLSVSLGVEVSRARAQVQALQGSLRSAVGDLPRSTPGSSDRLSELETAARDSRQIYENFLDRYQQSADSSSFNSNARLLSYASRPNAPSSPQLRLALPLALALGFVLAMAAGAIAELFDRSVKNVDDLEAKVGHPAIASIPTISKRMMRQMPPAERHPSGYLVGRPMSAFTEALRVLRTVIVYSKLDFSVKVVAVTSALPDEGKTTISMCLARVAAMSGQRVCVVDCDLRKQSINDVIDIETDVGILQVLAGEAPWRSAIVRDPNSDAHVLPVATSGFTPRDVFGSDAMARLINDLREHYDLVILDCAPILAVAETRILVAQADTTVLIARAGRTPIGAMRAAVAQTEGANGNVLGIALNYVVPRWQSYSDSLYFDQSKSYYSVS